MIRTTTGHHISGSNRAHLIHDHKVIFGCPMVGTFNIQCKGNPLKDIEPAIAHGCGNFYLVRLDGQHYGWAFRWQGSKMPLKQIEVYSKQPFPEYLKSGDSFEVEAFSPWDEKERDAWIADQYWFQSFPWGPQRADSGFVWDTINRENWAGATVLDIGTHYGFFAFQAAKLGAICHGVDTSKCISIAQTINNHIEMQDVTFDDEYKAWDADNTKYDFIFYLSVHHQIDREYVALRETVERLQARARKAVYLELIDPPLSGINWHPEAVLDGADVLVKRYQHKVRNTRTILRLEGKAK